MASMVFVEGVGGEGVEWRVDLSGWWRRRARR